MSVGKWRVVTFYYVLIEPTARWWRIPHCALVYWVLKVDGCKEWEDELQLSPLVVNWETLLWLLRNILQFTLLQSVMIVFIAHTTWIEGYETWRGKINAISVNTLNTLKRMSLLYCYLRWRMLYLSVGSWKCLDQRFSTSVRPRPGKFFFFIKRGYGPNKFTRKYLYNFFLSSYIKLT